ncbi:MAG: hypothetical protein CBARDMAM_5303 [uncultured Caballeronia sp.]|nr:MAG: hypothetical protein CBARDMAM_5303 [uncultured Caballeronia sp.]
MRGLPYRRVRRKRIKWRFPCRISVVRTCPALLSEALTTTKSSERIVVFVTPAQKLAITSTADGLGVSELMRRVVLSFNATSEQVKVAGLVNRLRAPKTPDPLNVALRQVAERAAAREARDAAQVAKVASKRTLAVEAPKPLAALEPDTDDVLPQTCDFGDDFGAPNESDEDASFSGRS